MTARLYYTDSFLHEFDARVVSLLPGARPAVVLDRTAFYPTSGGQVFDTGILQVGDAELPVVEVAEQEDGTILHYLGGEAAAIPPGAQVHGVIDAARRRDHMQQHSGQHVLSAAFVRLFEMPTVSFHMGAESCTIDLDTKSLSAPQVEKAEQLANQIVTDNVPVEIRFVSLEEARTLGLRKLPELNKEQMRLIDIRNFDLTACGGTHVRSTGQVGAILLRKNEKVRQGYRVEFVCGGRAVTAARRDYAVLGEAAALYSAHLWDVPKQVQKSVEEVKSAQKNQQHLLEELAELYAERLLGEARESGGLKVITKFFAERDLTFIKLLAQKITKSGAAVALLASGGDKPALVFAQSPGQRFDMGTLMKKATAEAGGRGGGTRDMAQGGAASAAGLEELLGRLASELK